MTAIGDGAIYTHCLNFKENAFLMKHCRDYEPEPDFGDGEEEKAQIKAKDVFKDVVLCEREQILVLFFPINPSQHCVENIA